MLAELFVLIIEPVPSLFFCSRPVSVAMDARLEMGLDTNVEIVLRRLTTRSAFNLITSLPHVAMMPELLGIGASAGQPSDSLPPWPDTITDVWSGPEYLQGMETNVMLTEVFDNILSDLHQLDSWLNLEKILQLWLTLNGETLENIPGSCSTGLNPYSFPRIPFGDRAVKGLLKALASHPNIKLRAWCLGFHCLILACKPHFEADCLDNMASSSDNHFRRMGTMIVQDENFEKMLLRFFSGADQSLISMDGGSSRYVSRFDRIRHQKPNNCSKFQTKTLPSTLCRLDQRCVSLWWSYSFGWKSGAMSARS